MCDLTTTLYRDDVVALFPGQGSISSGAGAAWRDSTHWELVEQVSDVTHVDVAALLLQASDAEVIRTDNAQLATFALSLVGYYELLETSQRPRYLLGHSLGEFSALVASGLLSLEQGALLIDVRGRAMANAASREEGSMVALMGGDDNARHALESLSNAWIANINGPDQIVLSGTRAGVDDLLARHKDLGWRRATELSVGGAFHSPLMAPAQNELDEALAHTTWGTTESILISNVDGTVHVDATQWANLLRRQLTSPVQFLDATLALPENVRISVEMPPGGVLSGLTKRIRRFDRQLVLTSTTELRESVI
ncbi:MAG: ACP S-malonyltransferase [Acidimicrobiales bacterium]